MQDSITGEVCQCGDHSGYCLAMQPWGSNVPRTPAGLDKHLAEITADENASQPTVYDPKAAGENRQ